MKQVKRSFLWAAIFGALLLFRSGLEAQTIQWLELPASGLLPSDPLGNNTNGTWVLTNLPCYGRVLVTQDAPTNVVVNYTKNLDDDNVPNYYGNFNFTEAGYGPYSWGVVPGDFGLYYEYEYLVDNTNVPLPDYHVNFYFLDGPPNYNSVVLAVLGIAQYTTNTISQPVTFRTEYDLGLSAYTEFNNVYGAALIPGVTGTVVGSAYPMGGGDNYNTGAAIFQPTGSLLTTNLTTGSGPGWPGPLANVPYLGVTISHQPGDGFSLNVGYICFNLCSNGCITIDDPPDIVVTTCSNSAVVDFTAQVMDSCCANCVTQTFNWPSGSSFPIGTTTVTNTATDTLGNSNSCTFTVTVIQTTNPPGFLSYPPDVTLFVTNGCCTDMLDETSAVTATNASGGLATITQNIPPGTTICDSTNLTFTATDACGNTTNVTVPVIFSNGCPACVLPIANCTDVTVTSCTNVQVFYDPMATSICCSNAQVTCMPASGSYFSPGVTTVSCVATDSCGNTNTCSFTVTVTNPCETAQSGMCNCSNNLVPNPGFESYTNCPDFYSELNLAAPWFQPTIGTPDYYNACANTGAGAGVVGVPNNIAGTRTAHGGEGYAGEFMYSSDGYREYIEVPLLSPLSAGHTYEVSFYVSLGPLQSDCAVDSMGAYFSVSSVVSGNFVNLPFVPQVHNAAGNIITSSAAWTLIQGTYTTVAGGESYLTIGNFNNDAHTQVQPANGATAYYYIDDVSVVDTGPCTNACTNGCIIISNPNDIVVTTCSNSAPVDYSVCVSDTCCTNCVSLSFNWPSGSDFPLGTTAVTTTATDTLGNSNSCTFNVTVLQITNPPTILYYPSNIVLTASNCCGYMLDATSQVVATTSTGGIAAVTQSIPSETQICGPTNVTFTATDACGNSTNVTVPVTLFNICPSCILPIANCTDVTVTSCTNVRVYYDPTATSICCSNAQVTCTPASGSFFAPGTTTPVSCSVTDSCGNSNSCSFTVTVASSTNFQVQAPANIMVSSCTNVPVFYPDFAVSNLCCTYEVVYDPPAGAYFTEGTASLVTWSFYGCSGTNILASGSFWVSVYCSNCCTCTNYTNYTVDVFTGSNYLGDWLCQGTNNTLADVLPSVPPGTAVSFWNPSAGQFITPADTFNGGQWHDGTEPLLPGEGFLLVSPTNTILTIYGCSTPCFQCPTLSCSSGTVFLAGTGLSPIAINNLVCGSIPIGTQVEEPPGGGGISAGLSTYVYNGNGSWTPAQPPDLQVGYAEFILAPPCPSTNIVIWSNGNGGSWGTLSNWVNNVVPNGSGTFADFSTITLVSNIVVILDVPTTIGGATFGDQGNTYSWTLADGGAGPLTLNNGTNIPVINVENQTATITAGIAGTNGLSKAGAGTLVLAGADSYSGPTMVNAGTLQLNQSSLAAGSTVAVAAGGNLDLDFAGTNSVAGLVLNGVGQPPGVYNSLTSPSYISGPGNLLVVLPTGASRANIIVNVSGGVLDLAWSANYTGWRLEMQTNHLAAGISSNPNDWGTVSGSTGTNQVQLTIAPGQPAEYYRLVYP